MIEYVAGKLVSSDPHKVTIDVHGLGYLVLISIATFERLPKIGESIKLYTSFVVREDSQRLFGFLADEERNVFETLNEISGVGPRLSLTILGHMKLDDLHGAIEHENSAILSKIPGIGKKTAERLILELRDKFKKFDKKKISFSSKEPQGVIGDAISALINLGYHPLAAQKAVKKVFPSEEKEIPLSQLISLALKSSNQ